jgi:hypothetical protein
MRVQNIAFPAAGAALLACFAAHAQSPSLQQAQITYDRQVAACNSSSYPAPQREACLRSAGAELDRARLNQPVAGDPQVPPRVTPLAESPTQDGRATVIQQSGTALQPQAPSPTPADTRTTQDGRATIVVPSDSTLRDTRQVN